MPDREWINDDSIPDDAVFWRGTIAEHIEVDPSTGRLIPKEGAFRGPGEVSMNLAAETTAEAVRAKFAGWERLWSMTAKTIRDAGCMIVRDPEENDRSHVLIVRRDAPGKRLSGSIAGRLRRNGYWEDEGGPPP